ncbi:MAG: hypothetical protein QOF01_4520 [Thermomicrobiales bacterium]|jgi:hypothetical protein|nr:hypothetical protein [Thermomicrobiales bacterium]MEA2598051.1 hypothetical protein [Thermomicrobiales bacterium]
MWVTAVSKMVRHFSAVAVRDGVGKDGADHSVK